MVQQVAVTGIQATGEGLPTLGNYLGMFKPAVALQDDFKVFYFIADLHALSVRIDGATLRQNTLNQAAWWLACGLNPDKATLFVQSAVDAHAKLCWVLNAYAQMGELERMTQFKDKSGQHKDNVNVALFAYPVLQAADIVLYNANVVPVGADQKQHIELTRDIAHRFNTHNGDILTLPEPRINAATARVRDLQEPERKMSKSIGGLGTVFLMDDLKTVEKKLKKAVTDTLGNVAYDWENQPGLANILDIIGAMKGKSGADMAQELAGPQYGPVKAMLVESVLAELEPIQQRYTHFRDDPAELERVLAQGAEKAKAVADITLERVYKAVGF